MKQPIHLEKRALAGKRLVSPTSERNSAPIGEQLKSLMPENASVLEIAAGTGQHAHHTCSVRPDICWQPTDIDPQSRESQAAYGADFPDQIAAPVEVDVTVPEWWRSFDGINAVFCSNMIHIAPWVAAEGLARGAGALLAEGGIACLYGPFLQETGNAESNLRFDLSLRERNPEWGVRTLQSVKHIFADAGLEFRSMIEMPANNFLLVFTPKK